MKQLPSSHRASHSCVWVFFVLALGLAILSPFTQLSAEEGSLSVQVNVEPVQEMTEEAQEMPNVPHHYMDFSGFFDSIGEAHFTKKCMRDHTLRFALGGVGLRYVQFLGCRRHYAATMAIDYFDNLIDWKKNCYFSKTHFHNLAVSVGGIYQGETWLWKCNIGASFDLDAGRIEGYTLYSAQLWGRYSMSRCLGLHLGVVGITGLHENRAWPIVGFDYTWRERWKLRLIYPVDLSLFYAFNCNWSVGIVHRLFWVRHRVEPSRKSSSGGENVGSFVEYRNRGTELALRYEYDPVFQVTLHVGYAHGGELSVCKAALFRRDGAFHRRRFKRYESFDFDGSGYAGGQFSLKF